MDFKAFSTDPQKEREGVWIPFGGDGTELKVARMWSPDMRRYVRGKVLVSGATMPDSDSEEAYSEEVLVEAMARYVLLDWKNATYNDEPFPYSRDNAIQVLRMRDFRQFVMDVASRIENFREGKIEADLGNLLPSSDGP